ncbi:hypothetical protein [uncultured Kocuria sp.]|uniref:hypothetical protein n=1 Tax=uncultured Kocuria sp. TaxID=259305 RepID=UPI0026291AF1|nr:hypothetical protein [uncultured Kocuria sp.]
MSTHGNEPEYGQRLPPQHVPPRSGPRAARGPAASPRAARRMARGLSFTFVMLGLLVGGGLAALGTAWGWVAGALLVLPGLVGFVVVQAQLHPALRDASVPPLRSRSRLWLIPSALLLLGALLLAGALGAQPLLAGTARAHLVEEYVSVLVVSGMTLVVAAGLGFGLVAMASFTPVDDDDSPLRPTGYAERLRRPAPGLGDHYDSEWIHRRRTRYGRDAGDDPGPKGGPPGA